MGLAGGDANKQGLLDKTTKEYETSEEAFNEALIRNYQNLCRNYVYALVCKKRVIFKDCIQG